MKATHFFLSAGIVFLLGSCGEPDTICGCIEAGKQLDKKANHILRHGSTEKTEKELQALKAEKKKKCKEFEKMDGPQMLERMKDCEK